MFLLSSSNGVIRMPSLTGLKCKGCGHVFYPRRTRCLDCGGAEFDEVEPDGSCRLVTFTELYALPRGVDKVPLLLGIVEFEKGLRAFGQIEANSAEDLRAGMPLRPVWGALRRVGRDVVFGFKFEPLETRKQ